MASVLEAASLEAAMNELFKNAFEKHEPCLRGLDRSAVRLKAGIWEY
jgi:hypothetical protein